jgi:hypothetical protein
MRTKEGISQLPYNSISGGMSFSSAADFKDALAADYLICRPSTPGRAPILYVQGHRA